ncbi:immune inhibitor A domain-containing protein [Embleya sp. NBC_00896]|uniref:immune inhibitor A domain-containing protein n=1 Tax=Embleya sp. NBC_00896 TaxID=2975961 RepID=UPI0038699C63|nr:immune inhibitor A [Embleya sp. NBC_00896]
MLRHLLAASALLLTGVATSSVAAADDSPARWNPSVADSYLNYAAPRDPLPPDGPPGASPEVRERALAADRRARLYDRKFAAGNPVTARRLARAEAEAARTGVSPRARAAEGTRAAKLLTILVEFNDHANDDFSGFKRPTSVVDPTCVTEPPGTVKNGPQHNRLPDPAVAGQDNNTLWVKDFDKAHFDRMLYSKEGITERVRTDLTGPDGNPGVSLAGLTMHNMYEEMSHGAYSVGGEAAGWVGVPHSEAWYAAGNCGAIRQDNSGSPQNPRGVRQFVTDAVDALAKTQPNFPWSDYDKEDPGDADNDGNRQESDGVIDHLVLVHAGKDKSAGGGAEGTYAIWAHASTVLRGHAIPGTDLKVANYIVQPEDSGVGVFAHEFGHDLGLPDLYDNFSGGETDVDFWDLMSSGSHAGPLFQAMPTHMGAWSKYVLGWIDPQVVPVGEGTHNVLLGAAADPAPGTREAVRVNLPDERVRIGTPHSGSNMWYSERDQEWSDTRIVRDLAVPAGADVKFWMWNDYAIEQDWDFGFVEVSVDGGTTWTQLAVHDAAGTLVTTPADYPDPNKNLSELHKTSGLTGTSGGWRHDSVDLTPYAGQNIKLRLDLNTDAAFMEKGWFADDFSITVGTNTVWSDDVEAGDNGWTAVKGTGTVTRGAGWGRTSGEVAREQYYLMEWRSPVGFDEGLKYAYTAERSSDQGTRVRRLGYNVPGMLVWLRDAEYQNNGVTFNLGAPPSYGAKGQTLIVDAHPDPRRWTGEAAEHYTSKSNPRKNIENRAQSADAAFGFTPTPAFGACHTNGAWCQDFAAREPVLAFSDATGWAPGVEYVDGAPVDRFTNGSTVVPARGPYSTRVVLADGTPDPAHYGVPYQGSVLGTGDPGPTLAYGASATLLNPLWNGYPERGAAVRITSARP